MTLENRIAKTADKIASLRSKMDALKDVKIPTQEYKSIETDISKAEKELDKLLEKQAQMQREGKNNGFAWENVIQRIQATKDYIEQAKIEQNELINSGKAFTLGSETEEYKKLEADANNYKNVLDALVQKQRELSGTTKEMSNAEYMRQAEENIDRIIARLEEARVKESEMTSEQPRYGGVIDYDSIRAMQEEVQSLIDSYAAGGENAQEFANRSNEAIASMTQELAELKARQKELEKSGMGLGFEEYDANVQRIAEINSELTEYRNQLVSTESPYLRLKEAAQNALKTIARGFIDIPIAAFKTGLNAAVSLFKKLGSVAVSSLKSAGSAIKKFAISPLKLMETIAKKTFSSIGKSSKSSNNFLNKGFKNILKYGLGIRSLYALVNKLRTAIKEGFSNMYNDSNMLEFKKTVDNLRASLLTLKNSFAAAFRPIVELVIPYIQKMTDYLTVLMDKLGQFFAAMRGQKTYTKAIKQTADYFNEEAEEAKNAEDAIEGYLSPLDEINKYKTDKSGIDSDAEKDKIKEPMFEEIPISEKFKDIAQWFKDMWANADFTELGAFLGQKLKDALDNIPWEGIKETAGKIGKSIATLINGFVEVAGLGLSIGRTLAEAINTGFEFLNAFVHNLHWESVGKFIADTISGFFQNIDWDLIYDTFVTGAKGLGDAINSFMDNLDWSAIATSVSNFVNTFVDTIYTFITTVDWKKLGDKVGKTISDAWKGIDWAKAGQTIGEVFKAFFNFIAKAVEAVDWQMVGHKVKEFLVSIDWAGVADAFFEAVGAVLGGLAAFLWGLIEDAWKAVVQWWHDVAFEDGHFTIMGLLNGINDALLGIGEWVYTHICEPFIKGFKAAFGIHSPSTVMAEMGVYIIEGLLNGIKSLVPNVQGIWDSMKQAAVDAWNSAKESLLNIWESTKEAAIQTWESIKQNLSEKWENLKTSAKETFNNIKEKIKESWTGIKENVKESAENVKTNISNAWTKAKEITASAWGKIKEKAVSSAQSMAASVREKFGILQNAFSSFSSSAQSIWGSAWEGMRNKVSSILSSIQNTISSVFSWISSTISSLGNSLRNLVSNVFSFGSTKTTITGNTSSRFSRSVMLASMYSTPSFAALSNTPIPKLATGAVIPANKEFLAVLGDQKHGTNVEAPLDTIKQAQRESILEVLSELGLSGGGFNRNPQTIIIKQYLDGKQVAQSVVKEGKLQQMATGSNMFALGTT